MSLTNASLLLELEKLNATLSKFLEHEEYLTVYETAEFLKVRFSFFYKKEIQSVIPHIKIGKLLRYKKSDLIKYLESGLKNPAPIVVNIKKHG